PPQRSGLRPAARSERVGALQDGGLSGGPAAGRYRPGDPLPSVGRTTVAWRMTTRDRRLKRKIERARRVLGTKTNRETIERALDTVLAEEQVRRALRRAGGSGGIEDVFGHRRCG